MNIMQMENGIMNITQKDKDLLLRYLSMALPYDVYLKLNIFDDSSVDCKLTAIDTDGDISVDVPADVAYNIIDAKPYLRPLSSMTEEEDRIRIDLGIWKSNLYDGQIIGILQDVAYANPLNFQSALIWLLQNHFDIFGLIPKDLAIEVTEENNPYK